MQSLCFRCVNPCYQFVSPFCKQEGCSDTLLKGLEYMQKIACVLKLFYLNLLRLR